MRTKYPCGRDSCILDRLPEKLVILGYRHWMAGYGADGPEAWASAWTLYTTALGPDEGRHVLSALTVLVRTYREWSLKRDSHFPVRCPWLCREECLLLSLISSIQQSEADTATLCLEHLVDRPGRFETGETAFQLAGALVATGQRLLPVPYAVAKDIAERPPRHQFH